MFLKVSKSKTSGRISIPGSKSHTIRALFIASLADGKSEIIDPLISDDAMSAVSVCKAFGAKIELQENKYIIIGFGGIPKTPSDIINVGNSGTTLRFGVMMAALCEGYSVFTGDYQIKNRPLKPLIEAINNLGAQAFSTIGNDMAPVVIKGKLKGGSTDIDSFSSQYLSSLLICSPLAENDTEIIVTRLNEAPYIEMTLWWLNKQGIKYQNNNLKSFLIKGGQSYRPFSSKIPGDFSSATFFMVLAAISGGEFILDNLDITDPQGDKHVLSILEEMGAIVTVNSDSIKIKGSKLIGKEIDMNSTPDALPAMAVVGCFAEGETRLLNVPQARIKETDRISAMCTELRKMGADIEELPNGLIIKQSKLKGCNVCGYGDHRVVMALAIAGLNIPGETIISDAEAVNITFPSFVELIAACNGKIEICE